MCVHVYQGKSQKGTTCNMCTYVHLPVSAEGQGLRLGKSLGMGLQVYTCNVCTSIFWGLDDTGMKLLQHKRKCTSAVIPVQPSTNSTGGLTWSCTRKKRKFRRSLASNS